MGFWPGQPAWIASCTHWREWNCFRADRVPRFRWTLAQRLACSRALCIDSVPVWRRDTLPASCCPWHKLVIACIRVCGGCIDGESHEARWTMMPLPIARRQVELAKRRVPMLLYQEIKGNHFFLLSNEETMAHAAHWACICDNIFWRLPYNTCIH